MSDWVTAHVVSAAEPPDAMRDVVAPQRGEVAFDLFRRALLVVRRGGEEERPRTRPT